MKMNIYIFFILLCHFLVKNGTAEHEKYIRKIHGFDDWTLNNQNIIRLTAEDFENAVSEDNSTTPSSNDSAITLKNEIKGNKTCLDNEFSCGNNNCIPKSWRCDGKNDCGDSTDEVNCGLCSRRQFSCGDGKCIPNIYRCDFDVDCADGSDEVGCIRQNNCTERQFACNSGKCIESVEWRCDGDKDCNDGSDEWNCEAFKKTCGNEEFLCGSGHWCIPSVWRCDTEKDCNDGSDELNCENYVCPDIRFSCGLPNNRCIFKSWVCNGKSDCPNGNDERNCTKLIPKSPSQTNESKDSIRVNNTCLDTQFPCGPPNNGCILKAWVCDGAVDCADGSDEKNCTISTPTSGSQTNQSISNQNETKGEKTCLDDEFLCGPPDIYCISTLWVCDGVNDCSNGTDERNCTKSISESPSQTNKSKNEIKGNKTCLDNEFSCGPADYCIRTEWVCDGASDCLNGKDEQNCTSRVS